MLHYGVKMDDFIELDGSSLTIEGFIGITRFGKKVKLSDDCLQKVEKSREAVERVIRDKKIIYGINTGFGDLAKVGIEADSLEQLQENLILSHCSGVGDPINEEESRGILVLRINTLAKGYSGIRSSTLLTMVEMLNRGIVPLIPSKGSLGASGDLIPLAHMANAICGRGECLYRDELTTVEYAFEHEKMNPVVLAAKEGLALINGTQFMCSLGALSCFDASNLLRNAQIVGAMAMEALLATDKFLSERVHLLRPHSGQINVAGNLRKLVADSDIIASHMDCNTIQDAYTLRCIPQILGASVDVLAHVVEKINIEMNSTTDNPIVFPDSGDVVSQGNFHGQPIAMALDYLGIGMAELGDWCERLTFRMLSSDLSGLPPFLVKDSGLNCGLMLAQYTAAALVAENRILCHPASVDSISSSAGQEDHVSMGATAALKLQKIIENTGYILAIGMLCAAQALEFRDGMNPGSGTQAAYEAIRKRILPLAGDRYIKDDIEMLFEMVRSGEIVDRVETLVGKLV